MIRQTAGLCAFGFAVALCASPAAASGIENAGTAVAIALPLLAGGIALDHDQDWTGVAQLGAVTLTTVGTAYGLKHITHEERPDGSDDQSMPSDTAALAFAPAAFLWDRYGWKYGLPAYAAAAFVGYSRVDAKKHHWYDVAASAGLAWGYSRIFTTEYHQRYHVYSDLYATPEGAYVRLSMNF
ncbi:MAG TPA: phosphatase PAP2 family protein [Rhizomicrobium sp.]|jgi:membrane-associated phospholipid phosphatase|nr:phosphatase PAP2 family protein [Rhizomicrobium sp.]